MGTCKWGGRMFYVGFVIFYANVCEVSIYRKSFIQNCLTENNVNLSYQAELSRDPSSLTVLVAVHVEIGSRLFGMMQLFALA